MGRRVLLVEDVDKLSHEPVQVLCRVKGAPGDGARDEARCIFVEFLGRVVFSFGHEFAEVGLGQLDKVGLLCAILQLDYDLGGLRPEAGTVTFVVNDCRTRREDCKQLSIRMLTAVGGGNLHLVQLSSRLTKSKTGSGSPVSPQTNCAIALLSMSNGPSVSLVDSSL